MTKHFPLGETALIALAIFFFSAELYALQVSINIGPAKFRFEYLILLILPVIILGAAYLRHQRRKVSWQGTYVGRKYDWRTYLGAYNTHPWALTIRRDDGHEFDWLVSQWALWFKLRGLKPGDHLIKDTTDTEPHIIRH